MSLHTIRVFIYHHILWICLLLFLAITPLSSQQNRTSFVKATRMFDQNSGLSSNMTFDIQKDEDGFIWVATADGINRFDGKSFKAYKSSETNGLTTDVMRSIYVDHNNQIWAGSKDQGLFRLDRSNDHFEHFKHDPDDENSLTNDQILVLFEDSRHRFWVGTEDGLNLYVPEENNFIQFKFSLDGRAMEKSPILNIYEDSEQRLWVGLWDGGLHLLDDSRSEPELYQFRYMVIDGLSGIGHGNIWAMAYDTNNRLWVSSFHGGLFVSDEINEERLESGMNFTTVHLNSPIILTEIFKLKVDQNNQLFISASNGLCKVDLTEPKNYIDPEYIPISSYEQDQSFSNNEIRDIILDDSGIIWAATFGGLGKIDLTAPKLKTIPSVHDNIENYVFDIAQYHADQWLATNNGIFQIADHQELKRFSLGSPSANVVVSMYMHQELGLLYLATKAGLFSFDVKNMKFSQHEIGISRTHMSNALRKIIPTENPDIVYLCTIEGLVKFKAPNQVLDFMGHDLSDTSTLSSDQVSDAVIVGDRLYATTLGGGLNVVDLGGDEMRVISQYTHDPDDDSSIPENLLTSISEDKKSDRLWIGSDFGLIEFDPLNQSFRKISEVKSSRISGLVTDEIGRVWFTSPEGVYSYDPSHARLSSFDANDGSLLNEYIYASYRELDDGKIFFGGLGAYNLIDPQAVNLSGFSHPILFTNLSIAGESKLLDQYVTEFQPKGNQRKSQLSIGHDDYMIKLDFTVLDHHNIESTTYSYRINGLDDSWTESETGRVEFSSFPSGTYELEIKAKNIEGFWSDPYLMKIIVSGPIYKKAWFIALCLLLATGLIAAYFNLRLKSANKRRKEIEQLVRDRVSNMIMDDSSIARMNSEKVDNLLYDTEAFYTKLFEGSPLGIFITDLQGGLLKLNKRSRQFWQDLNIDISEFKHISDYREFVDLSSVASHVDRLIQGKASSVRFDLPIRVGDNTQYLDCAISQVRDSSNEPKYFIVTTDIITFRKEQEKTIKKLLSELESKNSGLESTLSIKNEKLETTNKELKVKNEELERFAFIASHDLKEPVRNINSYLTLLKMKLGDELTGDSLEYFENVSQSTEVLYNLISDVLEYTRINRAEDVYEETDLNGIVDKIQFMLKNRLDESNTTIEFEDLPVLWSNGSLLFMVLKNLIENGIKFNDSGAPRIKIYSQKVDSGTNLYVGDNGIGIDQKYQEKIFDMFERLHGKNEYQGTGLGLALCKKIINRLGGTISVSSEKGLGSTFCLFLPDIDVTSDSNQSDNMVSSTMTYHHASQE